MLKLLGFFWRSLLAIGGLIGLLYLGPDWAGRQAAVDWWASKSPISAFAFAIIVYVLAVIWIAELEFRRFVASPQWPTVQELLRHGLGRVFKKDLRQAELRNIADDRELQRLRAELAADKERANEEHRLEMQKIQKVQMMMNAEALLEGFDVHCPPLQLPPVPTMGPKPDTENEAIFKAWDSAFWKFLDHLINLEGALERRSTPSGDGPWLFPDTAWERLSKVPVNVTRRPDSIKAEQGANWPNEAIRERWHIARLRLAEYDKMRNQAKERLKNWANPALRATLIADLLPLPPLDTEEGTPR